MSEDEIRKDLLMIKHYAGSDVGRGIEDRLVEAFMTLQAELAGYKRGNETMVNAVCVAVGAGSKREVVRPMKPTGSEVPVESPGLARLREALRDLTRAYNGVSTASRLDGTAQVDAMLMAQIHTHYLSMRSTLHEAITQAESEE